MGNVQMRGKLKRMGPVLAAVLGVAFVGIQAGAVRPTDRQSTYPTGAELGHRPHS